MNFPPQSMIETEGAALRLILSQELHAMHHPELADLVQVACFAVTGRTLWIQLPQASESNDNERTLNQAALRSGLRLDAARLYPERYETAFLPEAGSD